MVNPNNKSGASYNAEGDSPKKYSENHQGLAIFLSGVIIGFIIRSVIKINSK